MLNEINNFQDGVFLMDKPEGITSFDSLKYVKKNINKKAGHAGTLDKFASGLMIVLTGKCCKRQDEFMGMDKTYRAIFTLGIKTDTQDPEGQIIYEHKKRLPSLEQIKETIEKKFLGEIEQVPPKYSAIHINGKRAYQLAREQKDFKIESRKVKIYSFEIIDYTLPNLTAIIKVSKGTYIRSIARDLGDVLECGAYLSYLRRLSIGSFNVDECSGGLKKIM